jgi:hypothetical protein
MLCRVRGWHLSQLQGHEGMTAKFASANDAADETGRKTWQTPQVIEGTMDEAENAGGPGVDTALLS